MAALKRLIRAFAGCRVCVVGDFLADRYLFAEPARISREAPVLILREKGREVRPGGAGNAAANVASLGGLAVPVGLVGDDEPGQALMAAFAVMGASTEGLVEVPGGRTITKTRVVAGGRHALQQQVLRIDQNEEWEPPEDARAALRIALTRSLGAADAVLVADYADRVVDRSALELLRGYASRFVQGAPPVVVDTRHRLDFFRGLGMPTPNQSEVEEWLGLPLRGREDAARAALELCRRLEVSAAVVTRGEEGLVVALAGGPVHHVPAVRPARVYDVTGAGDTVAAVLALARAAGGSVLQAALLASVAGGIVVRKPGTATVSPEEMLEALDDQLPSPEPVDPPAFGGASTR
ncbi:bifunctional heptose 7-phosphate kinase/heptose 1-phosphate adenyltransferase [Limnochorda pilosa]|uniref:Carbohydrate kinase n=1 Tax=Limnochorda pilosa TaxID=1555112 RepID=A0A0K2SIR9_LIMPI|nr:PfkB family carbohydrate kinase [Limnochorda pilosa]BAS27026.1 carbohydrate kinase [Limnochorda pilosa]